jgi:hypothetical protein
VNSTNYTRRSLEHYSYESRALQITPCTFVSSNPRSSARGRRGARIGRPCSGEGGRRRRGPRGEEVSGAHGGLNAPHVEGCGGRKSGSRRESEAAAEGSTMTAVLRWPASVRNLRMSFSESWGRCWCNQLEA